MIEIDDLKALPPALRTVAKAIQAGKNDDEISDLLNIPKDRVRSYKQRLTRALDGPSTPGQRRNLEQTIIRRLQDERVLRSLLEIPNDGDDDDEETMKRPWRARRQSVELFQDAIGQWYIQGQARVALPATDWQVSLWLELCELRSALAKLTVHVEAK